MTVVLDAKAAKYLERLNEPIRSRIKAGLQKLSNKPPKGDIKKMSGQDGYRLRVGGYRILFDITSDRITVYKIASRGQIYKED